MAEWEKFYIHLVQKVLKLTPIHSKENETDTPPGPIDLDHVLVPSTPYIFNVCRLLLHALGGLRNAVPDGQHRIAGMVQLLFGHEIVWDGLMNPPRYFKYEKTHGGLVHKGFLPYTESNTTPWSSVLSQICIEASVRIFVPTKTNDFESECVAYSLLRSESQSKTKPRVLSDV